MAFVFGNEKQKEELLFKLIAERFDNANPLFTFMMIRLGKIKVLFENFDISKNLALNWNIHLVFILSNLDKLKDQLQNVKQFVRYLSLFLLK